MSSKHDPKQCSNRNRSRCRKSWKANFPTKNASGQFNENISISKWMEGSTYKTNFHVNQDIKTTSLIWQSLYTKDLNMVGETFLKGLILQWMCYVSWHQPHSVLWVPSLSQSALRLCTTVGGLCQIPSPLSPAGQLLFLLFSLFFFFYSLSLVYLFGTELTNSKM